MPGRYGYQDSASTSSPQAPVTRTPPRERPARDQQQAQRRRLSTGESVAVKDSDGSIRTVMDSEGASAKELIDSEVSELEIPVRRARAHAITSALL